MKRILFLLVALLPLLGHSQNGGFPVSSTTVQTQHGYPDLRTMFEVEGRRSGWSTYVVSTTAVGTVVYATPSANGVPGVIKYTVNVPAGFTTAPIGRADYVTGGSITCTKAAIGTYISNNQPNTNYPAANSLYEGSAWDCAANGQFIIPAGGVVQYGAQLLAVSFKSITDVNSATTTPAISSTAVVEFGYTAQLTYLEATDDTNFGAEYVIEFDGDSKINGTGPTYMNDMLAFQVRNYWANKGYNVRIRNNSISGSIIQQHEYRQTSGYTIRPVKCVYWIQDLTTNGIGNSINADSTGKQNARFAANVAAQNPGAKGLIFASTPRNDNATFQSNAAATNTSVQTFINALGNPNITFFPATASAWTATASQYYIADGLHWSVLGNQTVFALLKSYWDTNNTVLPSPIPR